MIEGAIIRSLEAARKEAIAAERAGDTERAAQRLHTVAELYLQLAKKTPGRELEQARKQKAAHYLRLSRRLQSGEATPEEPISAASAGGAAPSGDDRDDRDRSRINAAVLDLLVSTPITWDLIGGLEQTKQEIKLALAISSALQPEGVALSPWRNLLFYGPPGTGKTLLAAATSNALKPPASAERTTKSCFFNVKVSNVLSKYFGESTRIISELYGTARDISPAVVFLDEFESLTASREGSDSGAERRILSTLLAELDGLAEKGRDDLFVMTVAATNRPWEIDPAVLSRFEKKILIPLPDERSRQRILEIMLLKRGFELTFELEGLVPMTDGYSGRELDRLVKEVTGRMVAEANVDLVELFDRDPDAARGYQIKVRPLSRDDFDVASSGIVPQTNADEMARYIDWAAGLR